MRNHTALVFEICILVGVFALVFLLSSKFTDFKPTSLADNASSIVENIKNFFGGGK